MSVVNPDDSNLQRLIYSAIPTGTVTTVFAIITYVVYRVAPTSQLPTGTNLWLGRLYSLSFVSLLYRN